MTGPRTRDAARKYGVSSDAIINVKSGKSWRHV